MSESQLRILVDADACPVKEEILRVAERHGASVVFVANSGLRPSRDPMVRNVIVSAGFNAADDWIADTCTNGDVVITNDVPLAARCVDKGGLVTTPTGRVFDAANIGMASAMRDLSQHLRESGAASGGPGAFSPRDRSAFLSSLDRLCRMALKQG